MHLIDDIYLIFSELWRISDLVDEVPDIIDGIIGGGIQFIDIQGITPFGCLRFETVYEFGNDARAGGLAYTSRPAKQQCLSELLAIDGILQRGRYVFLPNNFFESFWAVFSCRNYEIAHGRKLKKLIRITEEDHLFMPTFSCALT